MQGGSTSRKSSTQIKNAILELAKSKSNGISNNEITAILPDTSVNEWIDVVNNLLSDGYVLLF